MKVLIVPDKFKGTLSAGAAAEAIACGWRRHRPQDALEILPLSDGGDGFGRVIGELLKAKAKRVRSVDAAHRPCAVNWWWEPKGKTAIIESAAVIGLAKLAEGRAPVLRNPGSAPPRGGRKAFGVRSALSNVLNPFALDTFGLGAVTRAAAAHGATRCLIGIGGSATNDGGFGLARALGWQFLDHEGKRIEQWTGLRALQRIRAPRRHRWFSKLMVAVDVQNPLLGRSGATRIYGPQKGLRSEDLALAEHCLRRLAKVVKRDMGHDWARFAGAGAAGGLGFGLEAFLGAELVSGFDLFARLAQLDRRLRSVNLVITGEGALDDSTMMGKGVGRLAMTCRGMRVPCIGLAGAVRLSSSNRNAFAQTHALTEMLSAQAAMRNPSYCLRQLAAKVAKEHIQL